MQRRGTILVRGFVSSKVVLKGLATMTSETEYRASASPLSGPQGICDLIGLAFNIWRKNIPLIFQTLILPTIFFFAASTGLQWCITYGISNNSDLPRILTTLGIGLVSVAVWSIAFTILSARQIALIRFLTGFSPDWQTALAFGKKRIPWLVGLFMISALISTVVIGIWICVIAISAAFVKAGPAGMVMGVCGTIFGLFAFIGSILLIMLLSLSGFSILALEKNCSFFGVVGEAFRWTFKSFFRVFAFGFIFYIVYTIVTLPLSLPVVIASCLDVGTQQTAAASAGSEYKVSMGVLIFIQCWEAVCSLLLRPVLSFAFALLYLDLRQRTDGIDLNLKLKELKKPLEQADYGLQGY